MNRRFGKVGTKVAKLQSDASRASSALATRQRMRLWKKVKKQRQWLSSNEKLFFILYKSWSSIAISRSDPSLFLLHHHLPPSFSTILILFIVHNRCVLMKWLFKGSSSQTPSHSFPHWSLPSLFFSSSQPTFKSEHLLPFPLFRGRKSQVGRLLVTNVED